MYAIVDAVGTQVRIEEGQEIVVPYLEGKSGKKIVLDKVLFLKNGEGKSHTGNPYIKGAKVQATLMEETRGPKLRVFKYKPKKRYRKTIGHRQKLSRIRIEKISTGRTST